MLRNERRTGGTYDGRVARVFIWAGVVACVVLSVSGFCGGKEPSPALPASQPASTGPTVDPELLKRLEEIDARLANVADMRSTFRQLKYSPMLKKPLESRGEVRIKGSRMLWETRAPRRSTMLMDEHEIWIHYPDQHIVEVYSLASDLAKLAASPLPRLELLREHFTLQELKVWEGVDDQNGRFLPLILTPMNEELAKHVEHVRVLLDTKAACIVTMEMLDVDGDRTVLSFLDVSVNTGVADRDVELRIPAGTRVVRPLEGLDGNANQGPSAPGNTK